MRKFALSTVVIVAGAMAFGMPDVPDVPGVEVPEFEIPGLSILDEIQVQLDELVAATDSLKWLIPELAALDEVSVKLEEMRETDPDVIGLQEELDELRAELEAARGEIEAVTSVITEDVEQMRSSLNAFTEGLPGSSE